MLLEASYTFGGNMSGLIWPAILAISFYAIAVVLPTPAQPKPSAKQIGSCAGCNEPIHEQDSRVICPSCGQITHWNGHCLLQKENGLFCPACQARVS
jgi:hypothetical protein